mgnify:CR=1 FL=1
MKTLFATLFATLFVTLLAINPAFAQTPERKDLQVFNDIADQVNRYTQLTIFDSISASVDDGLVIETNRSWSIDNRRLHFHFEGEAAWEIRGGERGRLLMFEGADQGAVPQPVLTCDRSCRTMRGSSYG